MKIFGGKRPNFWGLFTVGLYCEGQDYQRQRSTTCRWPKGSNRKSGSRRFFELNLKLVRMYFAPSMPMPPMSAICHQDPNIEMAKGKSNRRISSVRGSLLVTQTCEGFGRFWWNCIKLWQITLRGNFYERFKSWALVKASYRKSIHHHQWNAWLKWELPST